MEKPRYCVYIMTNQSHSTLYAGITSNLPRRIWEHKTRQKKGFTQRYRTRKLVFYQCYEEVTNAIKFEKQLKRWQRPWKERLIHEMNPHWQDLYDDRMHMFNEHNE